MNYQQSTAPRGGLQNFSTDPHSLPRTLSRTEREGGNDGGHTVAPPSVSRLALAVVTACRRSYTSDADFRPPEISEVQKILRQTE
ncbi:hypothetical protein JZ751_025186 [Albula glossodonta]|uniref:Uncharacterized protein n=1 Tax=Albula glossodonta TaxID=121402 RepID=A0A8T2NHI1_9TELE|nr:hypothetical protein JZ751_025186 [Albula glossodonta]